MNQWRLPDLALEPAHDRCDNGIQLGHQQRDDNGRDCEDHRGDNKTGCDIPLTNLRPVIDGGQGIKQCRPTKNQHHTECCPTDHVDGLENDQIHRERPTAFAVRYCHLTINPIGRIV